MGLFLFPLYDFLNPLTSRSDKHVTSPYNIHSIIQQTGSENTQTSQEEVVLLI